MKLEKFKEKNNNKTLKISLVALGISMAFGGGYTLNKSLASYQDTKKFNVIEGTVKYEGSGDVMMAFYQDDVAVSDIPTKENKYYLDHTECTNGATVSWNEDAWEPTIKNLTKSKTKCNLYFKRYSLNAQKCIDAGKPNATDCIPLLINDNPDDFAYDGTADNNLRYIGANPDNYVSFNNELWRIIGVMNNIDNGSGVKEKRVKLIRKESIGKKVWYDSPTTTINKGYGINEWSQSDIKKELNNVFWYNIDIASRNLVADAIWTTGANGNNDVENDISKAQNFYVYERSNNTGKICSGGDTCNDTVPRTSRWTGKAGLIYPSDYGYAVGGDSRTTCLNYYLWQYRFSGCYDNDWIHTPNMYQWTMTPNSYPGRAYRVFSIYGDGMVSGEQSAGNSLDAKPVVFLSSNVKIKNGMGTETDPYQLSV